MKSIPNKFSFYHAGTTQRYDMEKQAPRKLWVCSREDTLASCAYYTESEVRQHIADGDWWIIPQAPDEPSLVFPFNFTVKDGDYSRDGYTAFQGTNDDHVKVTHTEGHNEDNQYTKEKVKEYIKDGTWIVTSVGEQPYELSESEGPYNPPETPTSPSKDVSELTIKINSDGVEEAVERFKRLEQAVEAVNVSLESMQQLLKEIGNG